MNSIKEYERYIKHMLKRKISFSRGLLVGFLITGMFAFLTEETLSAPNDVGIYNGRVTPYGAVKGENGINGVLLNMKGPDINGAVPNSVAEGGVAIGFQSVTPGGDRSIVIGYRASNVGNRSQYLTNKENDDLNGSYLDSKNLNDIKNLMPQSIAMGYMSFLSNNPFELRDFSDKDRVAKIKDLTKNEYSEDNSGQGTALGAKTVATSQATSVGNDTYAVGRSSIAIGSDDIATYRDKISKEDLETYFSKLYTKIDPDGTKYGYANGKIKNSGTTIYSPTLAQGDGAIAIGSRSLANEKGATALGTLAFALKEGSTAVGTQTRAEGVGSMALGSKTYVFSDNSVATGNENQVINKGGMTYGYKAYSGGEGSIAIGTHVYSNVDMDLSSTFTSDGKNYSIIQNGNENYSDRLEKELSNENMFKELSNKNMFVVNWKEKNGVENVIQKKGANGIVIGSRSIALGTNSISLGTGSFALADNAFSLGSYSLSSGENGMALGYKASVIKGNGINENGINAMAIGNRSQAYLENSVALGVGSLTDYGYSNLEKDPYVPEGAIAMPTSGKTGVISVGSKGQERRIVNVAAGYKDTDAVNVSQLKIVVDKLDTRIDTIDTSGGVNYLAVEKANTNGEAGKLTSELNKQKNYQKYVNLKSKLAIYSARKEIVGETFNLDSLKKIQDRVDELSKGTDFSQLTTNLNGVELQSFIDKAKGKSEAEKQNILKEYISKVNAAVISDGNKVVTTKTPEELKKLKEETNYMNNQALGVDSIALGYNARTSGKNSGEDGKHSVAIGYGNAINSPSSVAIGDTNIISENAEKSVAIGSNNTISTDKTIALGSEITSTTSNSIFLGDSSAYVTDSITSKGMSQYNQYGTDITYKFDGVGANAPIGIVSVGNDSQARRIQNVATGLISETSTDAINGAQLYSIVKKGVTFKGNDGENSFALDKPISIKGNANFVRVNSTDGIEIDLSQSVKDTLNNFGQTYLNRDMNNITNDGKDVIKGLISATHKDDSIIVETNGGTGGNPKEFTIGVNKTTDIANVSDNNTLPTASAVKDFVDSKLADFTTTLSYTANDAPKKKIVDLKNGFLNFKTVPSNKNIKISVGDNGQIIHALNSNLEEITSIKGNNAGITFGNNEIVLNNGNSSSAPVRLSNVADGTGDNDAVNKKQMDDSIKANKTLVKEGNGVEVTPSVSSDSGTTYTVALNSDTQAKLNNIDNKASKDGSDLTSEDVTAWKEKLGVSNIDLTYKAGSDTKKTSLANGLEFIGDENLTPSIEDSGKVKYSLNTDLNGINSIGNNKSKLTFGDSIDVGGKKITNLGSGTISDTSTDSINGKDVYDYTKDKFYGKDEINNKISTINNDITNNHYTKTDVDNKFALKTDGIKFSGNIGEHTIHFNGTPEFKFTGESNINTTVINDEVKISMAEKPVFKGMVVAGVDFTKKDGESAQVNGNGAKIVNITGGEIAKGSAAAVTGGQLWTVNQDVMKAQNKADEADEKAVANTKKITDNTNNIKTNADNIKINSDSIATNTQKINKNIQDIGENTRSIAANTSDITTLDTKIKKGLYLTADSAESNITTPNKLELGNTITLNGDSRNISTKLLANGKVGINLNNTLTFSYGSGNNLVINNEGKISSLAKGIDDEDAINLSQLKPLANALNMNVTNGEAQQPNYSVGGQSYNNINDAITAINNSITTTQQGKINFKTDGLATSKVGSGDTVEFLVGNDSSKALDIKLSNNGTTQFTFDVKENPEFRGRVKGLDGFDANNKNISNVANAISNNQAVNYGQVQELIKSSTSNVTTLSLNAPVTYSIKTGSDIKQIARVKSYDERSEGWYYIDQIKDGKATEDAQEIPPNEEENIKISVIGKGQGIGAPMRLNNIQNGDINRDSKDAINGSQLQPIVDMLGLKYDSGSNSLIANEWKIGETTLTSVDDLFKAGVSGKIGTVVLTDQDGNKVIPLGNKIYKVDDVDLKTMTLKPNATAIGTNNIAMSLLNPTASNGTTVPLPLQNIGAGSKDNDAVNVKQLKDMGIDLTNSSNPKPVVTYDDNTKTTVTLGNTGTPTKLTNIADGVLQANSTDAVTGGQLYTVDQKVIANSYTINELRTKTTKTWNISANGDSSENVKLGDSVDFGGDSNIEIKRESTGANHNIKLGLKDKIKIGNIEINNDGTSPAYTSSTIKGLTNKTWNGTSIDSGRAATEDQLKSLQDTIENNINSVNTAAGINDKFSVKYAKDTSTNEPNKNLINLDGTGGTKITNLAKGNISYDSSEAINGSQLYDYSKALGEAILGSNSVGADGKIKVPQFVVNDNNGVPTNYSNVAEAMKMLNNGWRVAGGRYPEGNNFDGVAGATNIKPGQTLAIVGTKNIITKAEKKEVTYKRKESKTGSEIEETKTMTFLKVGISENPEFDSITAVKGGITVKGWNSTNFAPNGKNISINTSGDGTITGLSNTTWDNAQVVDGRAATEGQLKELSEKITNNFTTESTTNVKYDDGNKTAITLGTNGTNGTPVAVKNVAAGKDGKDAVNVDQINNILGTTVDHTNGDLKVTFDKIKNSSGTEEEMPTTFKDGIDKIVERVNGGIDFAGNTGDSTQQLGSKLSVKSGDVDSGATKFVGKNLTTNYSKDTAGNGSLTIGMNEKPDFKSMTFTDGDSSPYLTVEKSHLAFNNGSITGLENRKLDDGTYGTGDNAGRAATEGAVKDIADKLGLNGSNGSGTTTVGPAGKDGLDGKSILEKVDSLRNGTAGNLVYTDKDGNKLKIGKDGKYYLPSNLDEAGNPINNAQPITEIYSSLVNPNGTTTDPIALQNVASGLGLSNQNPLGEQDAKTAATELLSVKGNDLNKVATIKDLQAVTQAGIDFVGNDGNNIHKTLGSQLKIEGENGATYDSSNYSSDNLATYRDGEVLRVAMKTEPTFNSVKLGNIHLTPKDGKLELSNESGNLDTKVELTGLKDSNESDAAATVGQVNAIKDKIEKLEGDTTENSSGIAGKDGLDGKSVVEKINTIRNGLAGNMVYTDKNGNRLIAKDGKYYLPDSLDERGDLKPGAVEVKDIETSLVNPNATADKSTTQPIVMNNIGSGLEVTASIDVENAKSKIENLAGRDSNLNKGLNLADLKTVALAGLDFVGNSGDTLHKNLGQILKLEGKSQAVYSTEKYSFDNLITHNDNGVLRVGMAKTPHFEGIIFQSAESLSSGKVAGLVVDKEGNLILNNGLNSEIPELTLTSDNKIATQKDLKDRLKELEDKINDRGFIIETIQNDKSTGKVEVKMGDTVKLKTDANLTIKSGHSQSQPVNASTSSGGSISASTEVTSTTHSIDFGMAKEINVEKVVVEGNDGNKATLTPDKLQLGKDDGDNTNYTKDGIVIKEKNKETGKVETKVKVTGSSGVVVNPGKDNEIKINNGVIATGKGEKEVVMDSNTGTIKQGDNNKNVTISEGSVNVKNGEKNVAISDGGIVVANGEDKVTIKDGAVSGIKTVPTDGNGRIAENDANKAVNGETLNTALSETVEHLQSENNQLRGQVEQSIRQTNDRITSLEGRMNKGLANAAAMSGVHFMEIGVNQATIGAAVGGYGGTQAVAVGIQAAPSQDVRVNAKVSLTPGKNSSSMYSVGASWRFDIK